MGQSRKLLFRMSRHLLVPSEIWGPENFSNEQDSYVLVPTDGFHGEPKEIKIPKGLNPYKELYKNVKNKKKLKKLLLRLSRTDIGRTKDGLVADKNIVLHNINFIDAILNSCNGKFLESYEEFYCLLRKYGITF